MTIDEIRQLTRSYYTDVIDNGIIDNIQQEIKLSAVSGDSSCGYLVNGCSEITIEKIIEHFRKLGYDCYKYSGKIIPGDYIYIGWE